MNKKNIPKSLHHLIPLAEKWGIEDDGDRDNLVFNATEGELRLLTNPIQNLNSDVLNEWFCNPILIKQPTVEYLKYSALFMAFEYAKSIIKNK